MAAGSNGVSQPLGPVVEGRHGFGQGLPEGFPPPGSQATDGIVESSGKIFAIPMQSMGEGTYEIEWRGLGEDGHPMNGTFGFTVEK